MLDDDPRRAPAPTLLRATGGRAGGPAAGAAPESVRGWSLARGALRARPGGFGPPRVEMALREGDASATTALLSISARGLGGLFTHEHVAPRPTQRGGLLGWCQRRIDACRAWRFVVVLGRATAVVRVPARCETWRVSSLGFAGFARFEARFADGVHGWLAGAARARAPGLGARPIALAPRGLASLGMVNVRPRAQRLAVAASFSRALSASRPSILSVAVPSTVSGPLLRAADPQEPA